MEVPPVSQGEGKPPMTKGFSVPLVENKSLLPAHYPEYSNQCLGAMYQVMYLPTSKCATYSLCGIEINVCVSGEQMLQVFLENSNMSMIGKRGGRCPLSVPPIVQLCHLWYAIYTWTQGDTLLDLKLLLGYNYHPNLCSNQQKPAFRDILTFHAI